MNQMSQEHAQRWDAWQRAGGAEAQRMDRYVRVAGVVIFVGMLLILGLTIWNA